MSAALRDRSALRCLPAPCFIKQQSVPLWCSHIHSAVVCQPKLSRRPLLCGAAISVLLWCANPSCQGAHSSGAASFPAQVKPETFLLPAPMATELLSAGLPPSVWCSSLCHRRGWPQNRDPWSPITTAQWIQDWNCIQPHSPVSQPRLFQTLVRQQDTAGKVVLEVYVPWLRSG